MTEEKVTRMKAEILKAQYKDFKRIPNPVTHVPESNSVDGLIDMCADFIGPTMKVVEIGTATGGSAQVISQFCACLITIDNFEYMPETRDETIATIGKLHNTVLLIGDSRKLANKFAQESLDAVYIDARHEYEHAKNDLNLWGPKVKRDGVIAGHDYNEKDWPGVIQAVHEYAGGRFSLKTYSDTSWVLWRK